MILALSVCDRFSFSLGSKMQRSLWQFPVLHSISETGRIRFQSRVSKTELGEFLALTEFQGESSVSSSQPIICVSKRTHRVFPGTHPEFAAELSEFSLPKQHS